MPEIETLEFGTSSVDELLAVVDRDGAVIVRDAMTTAEVATTVRELDPFIAGTGLVDDPLIGRRTTRTGALVARSAAARAAVVHRDVLELAKSFLGPFSSDIQLNLTQVMRLLPGQEAQQLHRDRFLWGQHLPAEVEPMFNTMWALTDFDETNGATLVAPGSHRWDWKRQALSDEIVSAEMSAGSVLLYTGSVVHGGGQNRSQAPRIGMNITYLLGWLRQEENQYLSCPPSIAAELDDPGLQALLGYSPGNGALGYFSPPLEPSSGEMDIRLPASALGNDIQIGDSTTTRGTVF